MKFPKGSCALLIIDMQNGFVHPESAMGKSSAGTAAQQAIVPEVTQLATFCPELKIPVLWSQQEHFPDDQPRARKMIRPHSARQGFLPCLRGTWETAFYRPNAVHPSDHLITKRRASVFYNTNLETKLRMLGTRFLFITGCNTEFCVESTVRDAYARDFELMVVRDCVAGIEPRFHAHALEIFQAYFAEVMSANQLRESLI